VLAALGVATTLLALAGCHTMHPQKPDESGLEWAQQAPPPPTDGSIFQAGREVALFENPIAHHVGDIVTIVLAESTDAQKTAVTTTTKNTSESLPGPKLFGKPVTFHGVPILDNSISNTAKFDGEGDSKQSNSLTGSITVTVAKVLPNGNLYVVGQKQIGINQGTEFVRLSGVIRPIDLAPDNSISSSRVANAHITYTGKGAVADANAQSWLARFFNSPWMPF
jgi:flagellar L-ring protein FlgH